MKSVNKLLLLGDIKNVGINGLVGLSVVSAGEDKANVLVIILQEYTHVKVTVHLLYFHLDAQQTRMKLLLSVRK